MISVDIRLYKPKKLIFIKTAEVINPYINANHGREIIRTSFTGILIVDMFKQNGNKLLF